MIPQLALAGMGLMGGLMSKPKGYDTNSLMKAYERQFGDVRGKYNNIYGQYGQNIDFGRGLMDFDSDYNQRLKNQFSSMAADKLAQHNQANQANAARFGGLSGITNAQNTAAGVGFANAGMDAFNRMYGQNLNTGAGLVNNALSGQSGVTGALTGIEQNIADTRGNLQIANQDMENQWRASLGSNMLGFAGNALMPGVQSMLGGNPFAAGY